MFKFPNLHFFLISLLTGHSRDLHYLHPAVLPVHHHALSVQILLNVSGESAEHKVGGSNGEVAGGRGGGGKAGKGGEGRHVAGHNHHPGSPGLCFHGRMKGKDGGIQLLGRRRSIGTEKQEFEENTKGRDEQLLNAVDLSVKIAKQILPVQRV